MTNDRRRLRRLVVGEATWYWMIRQQVRPAYQECSITLSFFPEDTRRRLVLAFRPAPDRIISNSYFESGALIRLPDRTYLNLYEPGAVRRLLDAAAPDLARCAGKTVEVDGWPYFDVVVDSAATAGPV
ncbi:hypothetical protein AB4305_01180 [Nocardia sp. 2YAB30]|uniref:hypothetical protein n=1 Tax=unclassified Nocardia TaxID=2637762 RepID=UPI003F94BD4B